MSQEIEASLENQHKQDFCMDEVLCSILKVYYITRSGLGQQLTCSHSNLSGIHFAHDVPGPRLVTVIASLLCNLLRV
jgi:hypothetical protein